MDYQVTQADLKFHYDCKKTRLDSPKLCGDPNSALFSRKELYEVLYMLNEVAKAKGCESIEQISQLEYKLLRAPKALRSQSSVFRWLLTH